MQSRMQADRMTLRSSTADRSLTRSLAHLPANCRPFAAVPKQRQCRQLVTRVAAAGAKDRQAEDDGQYPERNAWTGGWAGGEKGVKKFVAEFEAEPTPKQKKEIKKAAAKDPNVVNVDFKGKKVAARRVAASNGSAAAPIYVGAKKGAKGDESAPRFIVDDDRKYPAKEDVGGFSGIVGGFAGGERGVQQFVEQGEVKLSEKRRRQFSPLIVAGVVAVLGVVGGLTLINVEQAGEELVEVAESGGGLMRPPTIAGHTSSFLSNLHFDERTALIAEVALAGLAVTGVVVAGQSAVRAFARSARDGAINLAKLTAFVTVFALAAKYVIEN